jgi:2-hydroxychromene-2-carboxylate isomerase
LTGPRGDPAPERRSRRPVFYYDFSSPYSYLAAERIGGAFAERGVRQPVWRPISFGFVIRAIDKVPWSVGPGREEGMREVERRAAERGLPPVRWPDGWPVESYSLTPLRTAVYAEQAGRIVSFSLAAFRQAFAAGRDLSDVDNVLLAAAACELHPRAVLKAIESQSIKDRLRKGTEEAIERGVTGVPTIAVGDELFWGDDRLEEAAEAVRGS